VGSAGLAAQLDGSHEAVPRTPVLDCGNHGCNALGPYLGLHLGIDSAVGNNFRIARKVRIEVGYGFEGTLTDAVSKLIIENSIIPRLRVMISPTASVAGSMTSSRRCRSIPRNGRRRIDMHRCGTH